MPVKEYSADTPLHEEERPGFFARGTVVNLCLIMALLVPVCLLAFRPPLEREKGERVRLAALEKERDGLREKKSQLRVTLNLLSKDSEYLEVIARDQLHMQKDGEVIFRFQ